MNPDRDTAKIDRNLTSFVLSATMFLIFPPRSCAPLPVCNIKYPPSPMFLFALNLQNKGEVIFLSSSSCNVSFINVIYVEIQIQCQCIIYMSYRASTLLVYHIYVIQILYNLSVSYIYVLQRFHNVSVAYICHIEALQCQCIIHNVIQSLYNVSVLYII